MGEPYVHRIRVRYGECDMQRVVFNANYLAYCDDAADWWFRSLGALLEGGEWDVMVKAATLTWHGGARVHDDPPSACRSAGGATRASTSGSRARWRTS
jgi:acyl-CoA thioesterase FadM